MMPLHTSSGILLKTKEVGVSEKLSVEIYRDAKKLIKKALLISLSLLAIAIVYFVADKIYTEQKNSKKSAELIMRAENAVKGTQPKVFNRTDLGESHSISIWFINDSDKHILVEKNGEKSLFSTGGYVSGDIHAYHQAGKACETLSFSMDSSSVISASCDFDDYYLKK